jgi:hypothetical protein
MCPIGTDWLERVTLWATTLEGRSLDLSLCEGSGGDFRTQERLMLNKCEIPRLLQSPDAIIDYCNTGKISHDVCIDLIRSRYLWRQTHKETTLEQAIIKFNSKYREVVRDWQKSKAV